jgi:serine/threonine protein kinase
LSNTQRGESHRVAIKSFKSVYENDPQGLTASRAFKTEARNLRELSERNHPHIVRRVATVVHGKQFLILSDWANGGDLKNFWEQEREPSAGPELVLEVVTQLRGLASAIDLMHYGNYMSPLSRSVSQSSSTHTPSMPVVIGVNGEAGRLADIGAAVEDSNWRHGDLKPENILRFSKVGELVGTLRISDLGLAKRHVVSTNLRKLPSTSQFGTVGYEPPEAMTMPLSPRSRLYDIWSLGCILLEFVVWLLYGYEGLKAFWKLPTESEGFLFWCRLPVGVEPGAKVNPSVTQIMDRILETNPACRSPSAIRDLLLLVKDRVLVPALPDVHNTILPEDRRIQANILLRALQDIEDRCKNPHYCCPGQPERNARLPTSALQPISRNLSDTLYLPPTQHGNGMASLQVPSSAVRAQRVMPVG